ncbi:MAG: hypothetical protein RBR81_08150 [Bacteroidales bacterium]|jgi:hypothetical protein|nr:hypothetical protein [Bacteroidales bacterium]
MKRILVIFAAFLLVFPTGCEKEQKLSEFVIGEWVSQEINMDETTKVTFMVSIEESQYTLSLTDGLQTLTLDPLTYTVDNELNEITIEEPVFAGKGAKSGDPIMITFSVTWIKKGNSMTWTPKSEQMGAPIIIWTRNTDM